VLNVGRLDRDSEGLLVLTDDGALCHTVLQGGVRKRYFALLLGQPNDEAIARMVEGGTHTHTHTHTHIHIHTYTHTHTHTHTHTDKHTYIHTHIYAHTHTHTHTGLDIRGRITRPCEV
jgi:pseudouridine synthase